MTNSIVDVHTPPINPQFIGGLLDGDGDTGHIEPVPPLNTNEESEEIPA